MNIHFLCQTGNIRMYNNEKLSKIIIIYNFVLISKTSIETKLEAVCSLLEVI